MANGFLQNSFRVGTPARGGGDIISALLGINTNPDVQLKGQLAGARLGNLDARTRRSNILGNQDQIRLKDMETIRRFITPEGDGSGGLNPEYQAMADPNYPGGQRGLATRQKRINLEEGLAELSQGGYMMEINGQEVPLATVLKSMSGADFKNLATTNPAIKKLMSQIKEINLRSADTHDLRKLQQIESGSRNLNIKARGEILDTQKLTAGNRQKISEISLRTEKFLEHYKKVAAVAGKRLTEAKLKDYMLAIGLKKHNLSLARGETDLQTIQILQGVANIHAAGGKRINEQDLFKAVAKTVEAILEASPITVGDEPTKEERQATADAVYAAAIAIVGDNYKGVKQLVKDLEGAKKKGPSSTDKILAQIIGRMNDLDKKQVIGALSGTPTGLEGPPGSSIEEEVTARERGLGQDPTGPAPSDAGLAQAIAGGGSGITIDSTGNIVLPGQGQTGPPDPPARSQRTP